MENYIEYVEESWDEEMHNDPWLFYEWGYGFYIDVNIHTNHLSYVGDMRRG